MWRAEGAGDHQSASRRKLPADGMDPGSLQGFLKAHLRQDSRQAPGQHRLPAARDADHQHVVAPGGSDFQRAPGCCLAPDLRHIRQRYGFLFQGVKGDLFLGTDFLLTFQPGDDLLQVGYGKDPHALYTGNLPGVLLGKNHVPYPVFLGTDDHGQGSVHGLDASVEAQFTEKGNGFRISVRHRVQLVRGDHDPHGDRKIEGRSFFLHVRRGKIDGQAQGFHRPSAVDDSCVDAVLAFPDGSVRQADNLHPGNPADTECLDAHRITVHTADAETEDPGHDLLHHKASSVPDPEDFAADIQPGG